MYQLLLVCAMCVLGRVGEVCGCCCVQSVRLVQQLGSARGKREASSRQRNEVEGEALEAVIESAVGDTAPQSDTMPTFHGWPSCETYPF